MCVHRNRSVDTPGLGFSEDTDTLTPRCPAHSVFDYTLAEDGFLCFEDFLLLPLPLSGCLEYLYSPWRRFLAVC